MNQQGAIKLRQHEVIDEAPAAQGPPVFAVVSSEEPAADIGAPLSLDFSAPQEVWSSESMQRRLLGLADVIAATVPMILVLGGSLIGVTAITAIVAIPLVLVLFKVAGLYNRDELGLGHSTLDEMPVLLQVTGVVALAVAIVHASFASGGISGPCVAAIWALSFIAVVAGRIAARSIARRIVPTERCLFVGEIQHADRIGDRIAASGARATIVDRLALRPKDIRSAATAQTIRAIVRDLRIHRIIIAPLSTDYDMTFELIRMSKSLGVRISMLSGPFNVVGSRMVFDQVGAMTMVGVPRFGLCRSSRLLKRALDTFGATVGLVLLSPVFAAIALAIKLDSRGPVFFRQVRIGRDGEPFSIFKFRTMVVDAEARKEELRPTSIAGAGLFKIVNDPRITRVGRALRSSSLDELPQLFNVLNGKMSLVGPRPLVTDEDAQVRGLDRSRLRLKPGMTGSWQLLEERVPLQEMVAIDYFYASSWSLWFDLKIILRTVRHVFRRGNV